MSAPRAVLTVPSMLPLVRSYLAKPGNEAGGSLHIVLDDFNVADRDVQFCLGYAIEEGDDDGVLLAALLSLMSPTQRHKIASATLADASARPEAWEFVFGDEA